MLWFAVPEDAAKASGGDEAVRLKEMDQKKRIGWRQQLAERETAVNVRRIKWITCKDSYEISAHAVSLAFEELFFSHTESGNLSANWV